jgi:hypothetical protein
LFDEEVSINVPRNDILVASGGKWKISKVLRVLPKVYSLSDTGGKIFKLASEVSNGEIKVYVTKRPIENIEIVNDQSGSGFTTDGVITITGGGDSTPAQFSYTVSDGKINGITKVSGGLYETIPNVSITGGTTNPVLKITMGEEIEELQVFNIDYYVQKEYTKLVFNNTKAPGVKVKIFYEKFDHKLFRNKKIEGLTSNTSSIVETSYFYRNDGFDIFEFDLTVVNSYTQYHYGRNHKDGVQTPIDYEALTLCMRKLNHTFKGKRIGLPKIGAGLAGGIWSIDELSIHDQNTRKDLPEYDIKSIIQKELKDCDVTIVIFKK